MSVQQRVSLFRVGAKAVHRVLGHAGSYICPICGRSFAERAARSGDLSLEHVPPRAVGGRAIALTCDSCNNTAGHTVEAELHRRETNQRFVEFMVGKRDEFEGHVGLGVGVEEVRARLVRDREAGVTTFHILGGSNDPKVVEMVQEYMQDLAEQEDATGEEFTVRSGVAYHPRLAKVAELKSAFLVAFAAFGYRYALSGALELVRQQILQPSNEVISEPWTIGLDFEEEYLLVLAEQPSPVVVVKLGKSGVILPWVTSDPGFYGQVKVRYGDRERFRVTATPVPWPRTLELLLDMK